MLSSSLVRVVSVAVVLAISAAAAGAWPHKRGQVAQIRFQATSTLVRGTWGWNKDTYLAELRFTTGGEPLLVRLFDSYPNAAPPLSRTALTSTSGTVFRVRRDAECDFPYGLMVLRTAHRPTPAALPYRYWLNWSINGDEFGHSCTRLDS